MGQDGNNYTIPLGIDISGVLSGFEDLDQGLTNISNSSKKAAADISTTMTAAAKSGDVLTAKMHEGAGAAQALSDAAKTAGVNLANTFHSDNTAKVVSLRSQIMEVRNQLAQMTLAGQEGSKAFQDLSLKAATLNTVYKATAATLTSLGSQTKGLSAIIDGVRGLAGAFAVGQGALALFGAQNEDAAIAIQKVQGAMALLMGVQEVSNVLLKDSALMVYLSTFARTADTTAVVAETAAIEGETVATVGATVATEGWTAALLANPIVAIVAVLAAAAYGIYQFAKSQDDAKMSAQQFNDMLAQQKVLLEQDLAIVERRNSFETATAELERKNQSDIQKIHLNALKEQKIFNQNAFDEASENQLKLNVNDKDYLKTRADLDKQLNELDKQRASLNIQINAAEIGLQKTQIDEKIKLQEDFLKERQAEATIEIEILKQANDYLNQFQDAKISELRDGQDKELKTLDQALKVKIQTLNAEHTAKLKQLTNQKADLGFEYQLADENGKKVIALQIANLDKQISLQTANGAKLKNLEVELTTASEVAKAEVIKKYAEQKADIEFQVANTELGIQEESLNQKLAIIDLAAQHEIDVIERTNQDANLKDIQQKAITDKANKDKTDASLAFNLKMVEMEKAANTSKLKNLKLYFDDSRDATAAFHLLEAKIELEAAEKAVLAMEAADKMLTAQEVADADARVKAAKKAVDAATKDAKPTSLAELLFPNDDDNQKRFNNFVSMLGQVQSAVDAYTNYVIAQDQKLIDAQKVVVSNDDNALQTLQTQLATEQALKDKGYANNVAGIQKLINEKNKQRDEDVKKQEEYQKKMEKVQKAQMVADTALQAVNLATAATKIFLAASDLGPVGEVIAAASVVAMIAAFAYSKAQAFSAANTSTMAEGGIIEGKSHSQGGQKYYAKDASGGIMELEEGEHVTRKSQTEKYKPLLEAINHDKLKGMGDDAIIRLLKGTGVHMKADAEHQDAIMEARQSYSDDVNLIAITAQPKTSRELINIDNNLQQLVNRQRVEEKVYEENGYLVKKTGNKTVKTPLKK